MQNKYACLAAGVILILLIATTVFNNIYVQKTFEIIDSEIDALPVELEECAQSLSHILRLWEERRKILDLTLSKPELEDVSGLFEEAIIAASHGEISDYKTAMARLGRAIADIKDLERISLEIIF